MLFSLFLHGCSNNSTTSKTKIEQQYNTATSASTFGLTDLSTFDAYVNDNIIHLLIGGKANTTNKQIELRYLQSDDGGNSWSEPVTVAKPPAIINNRGNDVQLAVNGDNLLALWQPKGELPGMGPLATAISTDGGKTWVNGKNPAINDAGDQSHADLIADQHGHLHAVWLEDPEENGYQSLRYARSIDDGKQWEKSVTLDDSTCSCCWNTLTLSPDNAINIYYRDMKPRDMALMRSSDDGLNWQRISTVGAFGWQFDGCPHVGGALAYNKRNTNQLYALSWTGLEGQSGLYVLTSDDNGTHWSKPIKLGTNASHGDIAVFHDEIIAVWDAMGDDGFSIFTAMSNDNGNTWSPAQKISPAKHNATHPKLAATQDHVLAFWTEKSADKAIQLVWLRLK